MEKTDQINQEVINLWKDLVKPDDYELMPLLYAPLNKDAELLFVGLNPSFGTKWDYLSDDADLNDIKPDEFFLWRRFRAEGYKSSDIEIAQKTDALARKKYQYFALHRNMAKRLCHDETKWEHVDLFFYRQTDESEFKEKVFVKDTPKVLTTFGMRQIELSKQLMSELKPKVIVVVNSLAADIFRCEFAITFDEKLECCLTRLSEKTVPTVFTTLASPYISKVKRQKAEEQIERVFHL